MAAHEQQVQENGVAVGVLENMHLLESKVGSLIEMIKREKAYSAQLLEEKNALKQQLDALEGSLLKESRGTAELNKEREMMRSAVDELIATIDNLVHSLPQPAHRDSKQPEADRA